MCIRDRFSEMKKNTIAANLNNGTLKIYEQSDAEDEERLVMIDSRIAKSSSPIMMYGGVKIGVKEQGDRVITKLAWKKGKEKIAEDVLNSFSEPCWLYVWAEDEESNQIARNSDFTWVGTKVTTFAELYAIYFRNAQHTLFDEPRKHPSRLKVEDCSLERVDMDCIELYNSIQPLVASIKELNLEYTNHYSNYNKDKSWSALSLRGYSPDPAFITKPEEMSKSWKQEHINEEFSLQDTEKREKLYTLEE